MSQYAFVLVFDEEPVDKIKERVRSKIEEMWYNPPVYGTFKIVSGEVEDDKMLAPPEDTSAASSKQIWYLKKLMGQADEKLRSCGPEQGAALQNALQPCYEYLKNKTISKVLASQLIDALKGAIEL